MNNITIHYSFSSHKCSEEFNLQLDAETLEPIANGDDPEPLPVWAKLDYEQCPNCPLTAETHPYCPLTANIASTVVRFENVTSYDEVQLEVTTSERRYSQETTFQRGIGSLAGLLMATSGCPHTLFLRPMARFHLPLATEEETIYRATSAYLLSQYFKSREGDEPDFTLNNLHALYKNLQTVNTAITRRLRGASETDSTINGVILLSIYAKNMPLVIEDSLEEIHYLFSHAPNDARGECCSLSVIELNGLACIHQ
ncbi:DUF6901 family protein [Solemya pervernicosa gill symbiont]|nr:hypothetical protein [Solemya pervernicosa gill symbiont]